MPPTPPRRHPVPDGKSLGVWQVSCPLARRTITQATGIPNAHIPSSALGATGHVGGGNPLTHEYGVNVKS